jgi:hypothetical protein
MSSWRDDPIPSPRRSLGPGPSPRRSPGPGPSPRRSPGRGRSRSPSPSPSQSRGNIGNVKRISEMIDIYGVKSLYKVIVDRKADYGDGYYKYQLDDDMVVDIKEVNLIRRDDEEGVDALIRILERDLGHQTSAGRSANVCIYYVKDAKSPTDAKNTMNEYSKVYHDYARREDPFEIRRHIYNLKHSKHLKLKTTSGGTRHQRRSRRGKGKGKGKGKGNGRGKKSRSSKTLRRGRR